MSKKQQFAAKDVNFSSGPSLIQDVSKEPKSFFAKQTVKLASEPRFIKEYRDVGKDRQFVVTKYPSRHGKEVKVVWSFDLKGEVMRQRAIQRHAREQLFPRIVRRFPRVMRFPRYTAKWAKKLGLEKA